MSKRRTLSALSLMLSTLLITAVGCRRDRNLVAHAGNQELTVDRFAEILGTGTIPLRVEIAERFAWTWIQYSLFGQRLAVGDSLTDSLTVIHAMWPDRRDIIVEALMQRMLDERMQLDSNTVDSAYAAGNHRMIYQILVRSGRQMASDQVEERRRKASAIRAQLVSGGSWANANEQNDDEVTKSTGGRLGVIGRGESVPEFEEAAFALAPDEISPVTESEHGFHIIWRPPLEDVRDGYAAFVNEWLLAHLREAYINELAEQWRVQVVDDAPTIVRRVAAQPFRALGTRSPELIATYEGGRFTDQDFARWLQGLPVQFHQQIEDQFDDEQMRYAARWVVTYQIQYLEAERLGLDLDPEAYEALEEQYRRRLQELRAALRIDSTLARAADPRERERAVQERIDEYVERRANRQGTPRIVPPFLAYRLRQDADWSISFPALERAVALAQDIRAGREGEAQGAAGVGGAR